MMTTSACTKTTRLSGLALASLVAGCFFAALWGCETSPFKARAEAELQKALDKAMSAELGRQPRREIQLKAPVSRLIEQGSIPRERLSELDAMAGPVANRAADPIRYGVDLAGQAEKTIEISLYEAIHMAVKNNLDVQIGSITPAVREADVTRAEARFDAVIFTNLNFSKTDQPTIVPIIGGTPISTGILQQDARSLQTGIRKNLITGGQMTLQSTVTRTGDESPGRAIFPNPAYESSVGIALTQPLLQGFGSEANLSEIWLNRNAHRSEIETYRGTLLQITHQTEEAYWQLFAAREALIIRQRLLENGRETARRLIDRKDYDAEQAQISDAQSRVQNREIDVLRARDSVLRASDRLKQLMNAPALRVGSETIIVPADHPLSDPLAFTYTDIVMTGLENRPEIRQALLAIDDASIRQMLAENLRLPTLDLNASVRINGLDNTFSETYEHIGEQEFIDFAIGLTFEHPIGNREAQSNYRVARLGRVQSVLLYERAVQSATLELKLALRNLKLNSELLGPTMDARLAATENLRTIEVKEEIIAASTPEFLNVKFNRQEALTQAELAEVQAITDYQVALSNLYYQMGIGLQRNQIVFCIPDPDEYRN